MRGVVDARSPRALGICDRCGARYNLVDLDWQYEWQGTQLQNIRVLVCKTCMDKPQEQLRTFILPPDPEPVMNPRPEFNVSNDNPLSAIGANSYWPLYQFSGMIGNMAQCAGPTAAFDGNTNKPASMSAFLTPSSTSSYVGKNWAGDISGLTAPEQTHSVTSFTAVAPNDMPFLASGSVSFLFQGSSNNLTWTTLSSGTTAGTNGEVLERDVGGGADYQYHRFVIVGDGIAAAAIAQLSIYTGEV